MKHITLVKKIKHDGELCAKCKDVEQRLNNENMMHRVNRIVIADERDPNSEGLELASQYNVDRAPFFIVTDDKGETTVYTVFFKFLKEVLLNKTDITPSNKTQATTNNNPSLLELQQLTPELDFL